MTDNPDKKYTVIRAGRHGQPGTVLEMHPRQATFMLTEQLIVEGELKGKALQARLDELAKPEQEQQTAVATEGTEQ